MVMGGDSCAEGCGFKSQHHILNGHFCTFICCKIAMSKVNEKEAGDGPFKKNNTASPLDHRCYPYNLVLLARPS